MSMFRIIWSVILAGLASVSFRNSWSREQKIFEEDEDHAADDLFDDWRESSEDTGDAMPVDSNAPEDTDTAMPVDSNAPEDTDGEALIYPHFRNDAAGSRPLGFSLARLAIPVRKFFYNPDGDKVTYVLAHPLLLIMVMIAFPITLLLKYNPRQSLGYEFCLLFEVMILFTIYSAVMLILLSLLRKKISARGCATMWLAPALVFFQVWLLFDAQRAPLFQFYFPPFAMKLLVLVWLGGFLLIFTVRCVSGQRFTQKILETSVLEGDRHVLTLFYRMQDQLCYSRTELTLLRCHSAETPFAMGGCIDSPYVVLPEKTYNERQLRMIFSHELHHLQRGDVDTKLLLVFLTSLCWFNPLVWIAARKAVEDLELSCDEIVTAEMDPDTRKQYALLLLGSAGPSLGFTTCLSSAAGVLRYRMKRIITADRTDSQAFIRKHKNGTICIALSVFLCCMSFGCIGITNQEGTFMELFAHPDSTVSTEFDAFVDDSGSSATAILLSDAPALEEQLNRIRLQKINSYGDYESKDSDSDSDSSVFFCLSSDGDTQGYIIYQDLMMVYKDTSKETRWSYYKVLSVDMDALEKAVEELP